MKRSFVVLTLVLLLSSAASAQGPEWTLSLKTWGAPWEKKFEVTLDNTGALNVTGDDPIKEPAPTISKLRVNLSPSDTQAVYEHALKTLREFEFPKNTEYHPDGTNLTLTLFVQRRSLSMQIFHISADDDLPDITKLFALLNKHLPKEHHVY